MFVYKRSVFLLRGRPYDPAFFFLFFCIESVNVVHDVVGLGNLEAKCSYSLSSINDREYNTFSMMQGKKIKIERETNQTPCNQSATLSVF